MTPEMKILIICQHMKQQSDADNPDISFEKQQQKIHRNCIIRMQKVKSDTPSVWIKNRICKQMI